MGLLFKKLFVLVLLSELRSEIFSNLHTPQVKSDKMTSNSELACVYAALILADDDVAITAEKITTILKAAKVDVEPFWPGLLAKCCESVSIKELISNVGSGVGSAPLVELLLSQPLMPVVQLLLLQKKRKKSPKKSLTTTWDSVFLTKFDFGLQ